MGTKAVTVHYRCLHDRRNKLGKTLEHALREVLHQKKYSQSLQSRIWGKEQGARCMSWGRYCEAKQGVYGLCTHYEEGKEQILVYHKEDQPQMDFRQLPPMEDGGRLCQKLLLLAGSEESFFHHSGG